MTQPIKLYTFGPMFGVPDAITLMKMSGLPFVEDTTGFGKAPKGKLPYIDDNGTIVADSTLVRRHLEEVRGIDFDAGLDARDKAIGWTLERMLEDHAYFLVLQERWLVDANYARGPKRVFDAVPLPIRPVIATMVRRKIRRTVHLQGLGRHSEAERMALAKDDIEAMAALLADRPYLFGDAPHGADATLFAFSAALLDSTLQPKITALGAPHANLRAFVDRMMARYFPGFRP